MHWIGFFLYYGWFSYSRELSQWRILLKKCIKYHCFFFEGQIVALKSMDKIEPLQTQKAWCWGSYLWNLSFDFNILQTHFRLNASFNDSIRLIRPNLSSPTVSRKGLRCWWHLGFEVSYHVIQLEWYVMYWIYLSTFQCCCCCCFWCWWCSFCCFLAVVIVAGLLVGVRLVQFFHTNKSKCVPSTSTNPWESQGSPFHPFTE